MRPLTTWLVMSVLVATPARADDLARTASLHARRDARSMGGVLGPLEMRRADVDHVPGDELVVFYLIEGPGGGNSWLQRLSVFALDGAGTPALRALVDVGAREELAVEALAGVRNGVVRLRVRRWTNRDPACCPTGLVRTVTCRPLEPGDCTIARLAAQARR